jgi:diaminopimelate epimerase
MIDGRKNNFPELSEKTISLLCDRHLGIGADGLILLNESAKYDFKMDFYNSDGKPGSMCGNGGRCIAAFANDSAWVTSNCVFEASDGIHQAEILSKSEVKIKLNDVSSIENHSLGTFLNTGSPHLIYFVNDVKQIDVYNRGREIRYSAEYPEGTNVNFVAIKSGEIHVRTYERGVENETLSCGTGVTASSIAAYLKNKNLGHSIGVKTTGGILKVEFEPDKSDKVFTDIFLSGPVKKVFDGEVEV